MIPGFYDLWYFTSELFHKEFLMRLFRCLALFVLVFLIAGLSSARTFDDPTIATNKTTAVITYDNAVVLSVWVQGTFSGVGQHVVVTAMNPFTDTSTGLDYYEWNEVLQEWWPYGTMVSDGAGPFVGNFTLIQNADSPFGWALLQGVAIPIHVTIGTVDENGVTELASYYLNAYYINN